MPWQVTSHSVPLKGQDGVWIHKIADDAYLCAVIDGHGDTRNVVDHTLLRLPQLAYLAHSSVESSRHVADIVRALAEETDACTSGACITLAHLQSDGRILVASLGDSPILWGPRDFDTMNDLSGLAPHGIANNIRERTRIMTSGLRVMGKYMLSPDSRDMLAVTRALGDSAFRPFILREPEIGMDMLANSDFLLIATDGFCDIRLPLSKTRIDWKHGIYKCHSAEELIRTHANTHGFYDDTTLIVAYRY